MNLGLVTVWSFDVATPLIWEVQTRVVSNLGGVVLVSNVLDCTYSLNRYDVIPRTQDANPTQ